MIEAFVVPDFPITHAHVVFVARWSGHFTPEGLAVKQGDIVARQTVEGWLQPMAAARGVQGG